MTSSAKKARLENHETCQGDAIKMVENAIVLPWQKWKNYYPIFRSYIRGCDADEALPFKTIDGRFLVDGVTFQFTQNGGCIDGRCTGIDTNKVENGPLLANLWKLQHLFPGDKTAKVPYESVVKLVADVHRNGIADTVMKKWYYDTVSKWPKRVGPLPLNRVKIQHVMKHYQETLAPDVNEACLLWSSYQANDPDQHVNFAQDTALPATGYKAFGANRKTGLQLLLQYDWFRLNADVAPAVYQTPEVMNQEGYIVTALNDMSSRTKLPATVKFPQTFNNGQCKAYKCIITEPVCLISGVAGAGKTHVLAEALHHCGATLCVTPSFKSAAVLRDRCRAAGIANVGVEVVQFLQYGLVHMRGKRMTKLMRAVTGQYESNPGDVTTIVFEECGMQDLKCFATVLRLAVKQFRNLQRIVISGDPYQLQSVDRGNVLADLLESNVFPHIHLTEVMRSNRNSALCRNQASLLDQSFEAFRYDKTFEVIRSTDGPQMLRFKTSFKSYKLDIGRIVTDYFNDCRQNQEPHIMAYSNREASEMNEAIYKELYPDDVKKKAKLLRVGIKLIAINKYMEGDGPQEEGDVDDDDLDDENHVTINKSDQYVLDGFVIFNEDSVDKVRLHLRWWNDADEVIVVMPLACVNSVFGIGYASTSHKVQGGEMPYVYVMAYDNASYMDCRAFYTMISRATRRVKVYTCEDELKTIVTKPPNKARLSVLPQKLRQAITKKK